MAESNHSSRKCLQMMINLSNVKHLILLRKVHSESRNLLIEIFKYTTQLSSLQIFALDLICYFEDDEISKYFNKFIQKLNTYDNHLGDLDQIKEFCQIFVNLEQLIRSLNSSHIIFLIKYLPRLKYIDYYMIFQHNEYCSI
ncbi:unnamed protein product [Adineta ricciae]|uniref:Uncharacterized protein n=1 Tax=Adineta ricciae TaxID=249248 RepID=A0A816ASF8_ADIRI|nr:unnamed protein product [Adineta ricciae]CAF1601238.1 unnamed protein product [Adineta ricciae]